MKNLRVSLSEGSIPLTAKRRPSWTWAWGPARVLKQRMPGVIRRDRQELGPGSHTIVDPVNKCDSELRFKRARELRE